MRRPSSLRAQAAGLVAVALLVGMLGGACSKSSSGTASSQPADTTRGHAISLRSMLLTVADLPAGWNTKPREPITTDASSDCLPRHSVSISPSAEADFAAKDGSARLDEIIASRDAAAAKLIMSSFRAGIGAAGCTTWTLTGPHLRLTAGTATALLLPKVGDDAVGVHWKSNQGPLLELDFVLIRKSGVVCLLTHMAARAVDRSVTAEIARAAAAQLQ